MLVVQEQQQQQSFPFYLCEAQDFKLKMGTFGSKVYF